MLGRGQSLRVLDEAWKPATSSTQHQKTRTVSTCFTNTGGSSVKSSSAQATLPLKKYQARKRAQRLTVCVWRPPGGVGVFHAKGWWPKSSHPRKFVFLGFRREESGMSGILPGCPGPLEVFKKFVRKCFCVFFVP